MHTKIIKLLVLAAGLLAGAQPALAKLNVFACEPEWQALVEELGREQVKSFSATTAFQDPHRIEARPSLIARVRRADLLICSGAELETGWLPLLLRQAANGQVLPGKPGYFEASAFVQRLEVHDKVDRSMGDVHASGNPHVHLDPRRLAKIAAALSARLAELDPDNATNYERYHADFAQRWQSAMARWQQQAQPLKGLGVVVHHKDWVYLFDWLGIRLVGALEPRPGLPTTVGHLASLKQGLQTTPARMIVHTAYQSPRAAKRFAQLTGLPVVQLPYTVGGSEQARDLFGLFDDTLARLLEASR
jgi:zinc/manganese transport system substrate-binding protein